MALPDFIRRLKNAPRSAAYGQHRKPSPQVHSGPVVGAGGGSGGTVTLRPGSVTVFTGWGPSPAPAIPYTGVRAGEIIGHRLWWVVDTIDGPRLSSFAHAFVWEPRTTIHGNVSEKVDNHWAAIMGGVYAYFSQNDVMAEIDSTLTMLRYSHGHPFAPWLNFMQPPLVFVSGTVKMWGEVVEHETGFRAEYAKPLTLNKIGQDGGFYEDGWDLDYLRNAYGLDSA